MTKDELSSDYYPQFCKGAMYVLLANLLPKMLDLSRQVIRIGPDDAYVGLLTDQLGISAVGVEGLFWIRPNIYVWFMSKCESRDLLGISDSLIPSQLNYIHGLKYPNTSEQGFNAYHSFCISLYAKYHLLRLFCEICLPCRLIFCTTRI